MTSRHIDFDAAFAELDAEPITVTMFGQDWVLPGSLPAPFVLTMKRLMDDGRKDSELSNSEVFDLLLKLVPADIFDAWQALGLALEQMPVVFEMLFHAYIPREATSGNGPAPQQGGTPEPTSSSPGGVSSKPTSPASTGSPSPGTWGG
jgi:hypothetical protein